jgi:hypothetical protein
MRRRAQTILPGLVGLLAILAPLPSFARERPCSPLRVSADADVRRRWPELTEQLHDALDGRSDLDVCARVQVTSVAGAIAVDVALPDGRSASRPVESRDDLVPTIEALLLLPQAPEPPFEARPEPPGVTAAHAARVLEPPKEGVRPAIEVTGVSPRPSTPPSRVRIELSLALSARVGDGRKGAGVGAISLLDVAGWLVGFDGRVDRYDGTASAPLRTSALEVGILAGRRLRPRDLALDIVAGPALALRGGSTEVVAAPASRSTMSNIMRSSSNETVVPRLRLGGHLAFPARSMVRTFVGLDGDVGGAGPVGPGPLGEAPGLPIWSVGLTIGATVGTL